MQRKASLLAGRATAQKRIPAGPNLHRRPPWAGEETKNNSTGRDVEVPQCRSSKQHHITSFCESWVMAYFHCFYLVFLLVLLVLIRRGDVRKSSLHCSSLGMCGVLNIVYKGKYFSNISIGIRSRRRDECFHGGPWAGTACWSKNMILLNLAYRSWGSRVHTHTEER